MRSMVSVVILFASLVAAQIAPGTSAGEGSISGPASSPQAAQYSCDPAKCQLPNCRCASTSIPGGLSRDETPMFITVTSDDAVQVYTQEVLNHLLGARTNPNGCKPRSTYFVSLQYCNMSLVTDLYVDGTEIADHTMSHQGDPSQAEIDGNLRALNAFSGIPFTAIQGFRTPFLNYSVQTLQHLQRAQFAYDSSAASATPVTDPNTDAFWPYTLDNGLANDCIGRADGLCKGEPKLPGLWEIPMYSTFDEAGAPHLMDAYLDNQDATIVGQWYRNTFDAHYDTSRVPFGLYNHPIHLAVGYPGLPDPLTQRKMLNDFLDYAQQRPNVWIINNVQLLAWMRNPVPAAQLNTIPEFQCPKPQVNATICNGMYPNQIGLLQNCPFPDFPWTTCYSCPNEPPSAANPVPPSATGTSQSVRYRIPSNCSTVFWDPIGNKCLCNGGACSFIDVTRPIGPNGQNLTGGGTGTSDPTAPSKSFVPFGNGATTQLASFAMIAFPVLSAFAYMHL